MIRFVLPIVVLATCAGCSGGVTIDRDLVCSVMSSASSRVPEGAAAWDWPAAARAEVERPGWTEAEDALMRSCSGGSRPAVVRVAFSADRKLALITRSSFERGASPEPDPEFQPAIELTGAIESCLLRRERVLSSELWQPMACKLDAVS